MLYHLLASFILLLDGLDLLIRLYFRHRHTLPGESGGRPSTSVPLQEHSITPYRMRLHLRPYALLVSVHNPGRQLEEFLEAIGAYREHLWVIDDASTDDTWSRLQSAQVHCIRALNNQRKPGAIRRLLAALPAEVETVVILDPDARILENRAEPISRLERVLFDFQRSGMAAVCPKLAIKKDGWLVTMQALEYCFAFGLGRKSLADHAITSGIAVYKRDALERLLEGHTLSIYAEDLKNALLLLGDGERIYYDERLVIETEAKDTWRSWFSQRVGWFYGLFKVYGEHLVQVVRGAQGRAAVIYQFIIYMGLFTMLFHPLKLLSMAVLLASASNGLDRLLGVDLIPDTAATNPVNFMLVYLEYTALTIVSLMLSAGPGERARLLPATPSYFFYVVAHVVPVTIGYLNWFALGMVGRRVYRDHFEDEEKLYRESLKPLRVTRRGSVTP